MKSTFFNNKSIFTLSCTIILVFVLAIGVFKSPIGIEVSSKINKSFHNIIESKKEHVEIETEEVPHFNMFTIINKFLPN